MNSDDVWNKYLGLAEELVSGFSGAGDPIQRARAEEIVKLLSEKLAAWKDSSTLPWAKYDEGARLRLEGALEFAVPLMANG